jgi:hypothetical protein
MRVVRRQIDIMHGKCPHGESPGRSGNIGYTEGRQTVQAFVYFSWRAGVLVILGQWGAALCIRSRPLIEVKITGSCLEIAGREGLQSRAHWRPAAEAEEWRWSGLL